MHILVKLRQKCILNENFSLKMISNAKKKIPFFTQRRIWNFFYCFRSPLFFKMKKILLPCSQDEMASTSSNSYDMPQLETPSRRSKLADRTSSLLSQLHPGRWVRSHHGEHSTHHHHHSSSTTTGSSHHQHRKDSSTSPAVTPPPSNKSALLTNPATLAHSREKAKRWVREQATRFLESYFKVSLTSIWYLD